MHDCPEKAPLRRPRHWPCADHVARTNASVSNVFTWLQVTRQLCTPVDAPADRHHVPAPASSWRFGDYVDATPICPKTPPSSATASRNSLPSCYGMLPTRSSQSAKTPRIRGILERRRSGSSPRPTAMSIASSAASLKCFAELSRRPANRGCFRDREPGQHGANGLGEDVRVRRRCGVSWGYEASARFC